MLTFGDRMNVSAVKPINTMSYEDFLCWIADQMQASGLYTEDMEITEPMVREYAIELLPSICFNKFRSFSFNEYKKLLANNAEGDVLRHATYQGKFNTGQLCELAETYALSTNDMTSIPWGRLTKQFVQSQPKLYQYVLESKQVGLLGYLHDADIDIDVITNIVKNSQDGLFIVDYLLNDQLREIMLDHYLNCGFDITRLTKRYLNDDIIKMAFDKNDERHYSWLFHQEELLTDAQYKKVVKKLKAKVNRFAPLERMLEVIERKTRFKFKSEYSRMVALSEGEGMDDHPRIQMLLKDKIITLDMLYNALNEYRIDERWLEEE